MAMMHTICCAGCCMRLVVQMRCGAVTMGFVCDGEHVVVSRHVLEEEEVNTLRVYKKRTLFIEHTQTQNKYSEHLFVRQAYTEMHFTLELYGAPSFYSITAFVLLMSPSATQVAPALNYTRVQDAYTSSLFKYFVNPLFSSSSETRVSYCSYIRCAPTNEHIHIYMCLMLLHPQGYISLSVCLSLADIVLTRHA